MEEQEQQLLMMRVTNQSAADPHPWMNRHQKFSCRQYVISLQNSVSIARKDHQLPAHEHVLE
jgi:hypothetical protein